MLALSQYRCRPGEGVRAGVGRGIQRRPAAWIPGFEPPYIVAMVEIAEEPGVRLISNVVDVEPADMRIGLEVDVFFEDWTGLSGEEDTRVWIPLFRPVTH